MIATRQDWAFSLIEVTLAIGIIGFALIAILGLVPIGQNAARDAADDTRGSLIEQDVFARVRASIDSAATFTTPTTVFPSPPSGPNFYYTNDGVFFSDRAGLLAAVTLAKASNRPLPNYGVTVIVGSSFATALPNVTNATLKPVTATLGYPIDGVGNVIGPTINGVQANAARKTFTFYLRKP